MAVLQCGALHKSRKDIRFKPAIEVDRFIRPVAGESKLSPGLDVCGCTSLVVGKDRIDLLQG